MKPTEPNFWGIHASRTGDADSLFLKKNCVALGWQEMGDPVVSALYAKVGPLEFGLLVTLGTFTSQAKNFAKSNLRLVDGDELVDLIFHHYDQFDARYKGVLPLKRVYVPEVIEGVEE